MCVYAPATEGDLKCNFIRYLFLWLASIHPSFLVWPSLEENWRYKKRFFFLFFILNIFPYKDPCRGLVLLASSTTSLSGRIRGGYNLQEEQKMRYMSTRWFIKKKVFAKWNIFLSAFTFLSSFPPPPLEIMVNTIFVQELSRFLGSLRWT